jgi:hypothetical protein
MKVKIIKLRRWLKFQMVCEDLAEAEAASSGKPT